MFRSGKATWILLFGFALLVGSAARCPAEDLFDVLRGLLAGEARNGQKADAGDGEFTSTHKQSHLIKVLEQQDEEGRALKSFCLNSDGNILAAISASPGEIRIHERGGDLIDTIELTVRPDAINLAGDGTILIAGEGKLQRLDASGKVLHEADAPHIEALKSDPEGMRKLVIEQHKQTFKSMKSQLDMFKKQRRKLMGMSEAVEQELALLEAAIAKTADRREGDLTDGEREVVALRRKLATAIRAEVEANVSESQRSQIDMFEQQMEFYENYLEEHGGEELTEAQIQQKVDAMVSMKSQVASISSIGDMVYLAAYSAKGYTFDVWKMSSEFEDGETVVTGLSGCCGQMDVQCCESGIFVAENSRTRICHFDADGKKVTSWGKRARSGVRGFGGCCNPMNVAFGKDGSVYAAESGSGRIKRYSVDGELLELIGSVELVPGCKKVSIAVGEDGKRIYMLDITRNHIIVMEAKDDAVAAGEKEKAEAADAQAAINVFSFFAGLQ